MDQVIDIKMEQLDLYAEEVKYSDLLQQMSFEDIQANIEKFMKLDEKLLRTMDSILSGGNIQLSQLNNLKYIFDSYIPGLNDCHQNITTITKRLRATQTTIATTRLCEGWPYDDSKFDATELTEMAKMLRFLGRHIVKMIGVANTSDAIKLEFSDLFRNQLGFDLTEWRKLNKNYRKKVAAFSAAIGAATELNAHASDDSPSSNSLTSQ